MLRAIESATGIAPKRTGRGWRSPCPSCGGRSAKLSLGEADNGGVLAHCFAGCDVSAVLAACGLSLGDLYPPRPNDSTREGRRSARQAMREANTLAAMAAISHEALIVLICAGDTRLGDISTTDYARLAQAEERIAQALEAINVRAH